MPLGPSITAPSEQLRRVNADPAGDRRDARARLQRLCHNLRLELVRPASAKLPRRSLETVGDRFDHMEGSSSRTRRRHRTSHRLTNSAADSRSLTTPPDGVSLPLTVDRLIAHLGHDDAATIARADIVASKDALLEGGMKNITVRDVYLASTKAMFQFAVDQGLLAENPAKEVKVRVRKKIKEREKGFDGEEAANSRLVGGDRVEIATRSSLSISSLTPRTSHAGRLGRFNRR